MTLMITTGLNAQLQRILVLAREQHPILFGSGPSNASE